MKQLKTSLTRAIRKTEATIVAVFVVFALPGCSSSSENALEAGAVAQQYLDERNFFEARKAITEAISERDDITNLHLLKGRIELGSGRPLDAFLAYSNALSLEPTNPEALQAVSQLGLQTGHFRDAERAADTILSFSPELPDAMLTKGLIALVRRKHEKALEFAERILTVRPGDEAGTILKARTLALTGNTGQAIDLLQNSTPDQNFTEGVDLTLIELYRETSNLVEMQATFKRLLARRPQDMALRMDYANTLYKSGDTSQARELIEGMLRNNLRDKRALATMTGLWLEYDANVIDAALLDFLSKEGSLEARIAIARYLLAIKKPSEARDILRSVSSFSWSEAPALYARALYSLGETDEAYDRAVAILDEDDTNADALLVRARHHLANRDFVQAINDAQIVIRDNPKLAAGYMGLIDIYQAKKDKSGVKRVFADAAEQLPQDPLLFKAYGEFLLDNGDPVRALSVIRKHARDTPASLSAWRLYQETCETAASQRCKQEADNGKQIASVIYAVDVPPGTPPTRGLFGRLK